MKNPEKNECPIRVLDIGPSDSLRLCNYGICRHILLKSEKKHCPCHTPKPEGVCQNCLKHGIICAIPAPEKPKEKCKDCQFEGNDHSFECPQYIETIPPEVSPEKEKEKLPCLDKKGQCKYESCDDCKLDGFHGLCCPSKDTPTLNEQKGEWQTEFFEKFSHIQAVKNEKGGNQYTRIVDFIAAKLAQKEQAVKAEIREMIEGMKIGANSLLATDCAGVREDAYNKALSNIISLLSDKVNH